jgi:pyridoxal biosynthesis lyase PdxS
VYCRQIEEIQFCRAKKEFDVPIIMAASDVDEAVEGLMDEISFTRVNNEARVRAVEEMEQKMKKRKEFEREADPVVRFAKDLNMVPSLTKCIVVIILISSREK